MTAKKKTSETYQFNGVLDAFVSQIEKKTDDSSLLPLDIITLPKNQPRRYFDPQKLEKLQHSIEQYGILEPLIVRPCKDNTYELVAGERRYRAAVELKLTAVPVVIRNLNDKEAMQVALIENLQREDLNPVEETQGILNLLSLELDMPSAKVKSLLTQMKHTADQPGHNVMPSEANIVEKLLTSLGKMTWESYVKNRLPLLNLPEELLQALEQGSIEYTKARAIATIKDETIRKFLLTEAISQSLSLSQIRERIAKLKSAQANEKKEHTDKIEAYQQRLKAIHTKLKKIKSWDEPQKQEEFESLLEKLEKLF